MSNKEQESLFLAASNYIAAHRKSVLLVEDTAAHAALIKRPLLSADWEVEHTTRASDALKAFSLDSNRIIILDLSLPDADGLALIEAFRELNPAVSIIVSTSTNQVSVSVEAMRRGASDYVVKSEPKETGEQTRL